jgi:two-component system NtrC family sensor kinase
MIAVTLAFSLIPLLGIGAAIHYQYDSAYDKKVMESDGIIVQNRRAAVELFLDKCVDQLRLITETHSLEQLRDQANLSKIFNTLRSRSQYIIDLNVIDDRGTPLSYVGPYYKRLKSVNYADQEWFQAVMASHVYISDVFLGFRDIPHMIIAVATSDGKETWILRATINSETISRIIRQGGLGNKDDVFIVSSKNVLQTETILSGKIMGSPNSPDFSSSDGTRVEKVARNGEEIIFATSTIMNPKWVVVLKDNVDQELEPIYMARAVVFSALGACGLLITIGTLLTTRSMTNELVRVERDKALSDDIAHHSSKMAAIGKLAAGVAHEINNPLAIIDSTAGWIGDCLRKEDLSNNPNLRECRDCVKKIERQVERSRNIVHRLMGFARRINPTLEVTDVNGVLSETIGFLMHEAIQRDITIKTDYDPKLPRITTDPGQLQQVFLNVVSNAIDAIGKKGNINVRTSHDSDELKIEIKDDGPGIQKDVLEKIFDPFFTTKGPGSGTGLGLSISHGIISQLGGIISVESRHGEGATFNICLPVK